VRHWKKAQTKVLETLGEDRWSRMMGDLAAVALLSKAR